MANGGAAMSPPEAGIPFTSLLGLAGLVLMVALIGIAAWIR